MASLPVKELNLEVGKADTEAWLSLALSMVSNYRWICPPTQDIYFLKIRLKDSSVVSVRILESMSGFYNNQVPLGLERWFSS